MGIFNSLFGGSSSKPKYNPSPEERNYSQGSIYSLGNRVGAVNTGETTGKDGGFGMGATPIFDYSNVGHQVGMPEATAPYDYSATNKAINTLSNPSLQVKAYDPYQFHFEGLPETYGHQAYEQGAQDIRRESAGQLTQAQRAIGTRRPGLLLKAGQSNGRNVAETLGNLSSQLGLKQMDQNVQLGKDQQTEQAGENYNAYASRPDTAPNALAASSNALNYANSLAGVNQNKILGEANITNQEREYQDKGLQWIMDLYKNLVDSRRGAGDRQSSSNGAIGSIAGAAAGFL